MENKEAIMILKYVLGQSKERKGTMMFDKGITLFPDIHKEREAIRKGIEALEKTEGMVEVQVVSAKYFTDKPKENAETESDEIKFGEF